MPTSADIKPIQRKLGRNGPSVNALGLGCMGMSAFYGQLDEARSTKTLEKALDIGCTFWDTADIYKDNEIFLSKILKTRRKDVFLCTKFGIQFGEQGANVNGTPEYVRQACEKSLQRLGVETIDLYYQHRVDPKTPIEETIKTLAELVKEGKIRYIGLSECSAETLRRAHAVHPISAVQIEYSPWTLDIETNGLLATARELGVSIVAYSPLGRGFLTGRYKSPDDLDADDWRKGNPRFQGENFYKNLKLVERIEQLAQKKGVTAGQLTLAWVLHQGEEFLAIPGTTRVENLEANWASQNIKITPEDDAAIRAAINEIGVSGDRYDEHSMATLNR
ncbi:hypothetical protein SpCBS45565_g01795 [Spizellomyces sp. 'palustris']|nr:hypothetical protein SpCBS45565_g01795 [Spizellomyces sp. 'palustris']